VSQLENAAAMGRKCGNYNKQMQQLQPENAAVTTKRCSSYSNKMRQVYQ
jgi:hypothetical protein